MTSYGKYYTDEGPIKSRPFAVASLGVDRIFAKSDFALFQRSNPADRRFAKDGRVLSSLVLVYVSNGNGYFYSKASGRLAVPVNTAFFAFPGVRHFYRYDDAVGWDAYWIEVDPSAVLPLLAEAGITPENPLRTFRSFVSLADAFRDAFEVARTEPRGETYRIEAAAHRIVAETIAAWRSNTSIVTEAAKLSAERLREVILSDLSSPLSIREASDAVGMSQSRLRAVFKQSTGLSPKSYQQRARFLKVLDLLRMTNLSVAAIAEKVGFSDPYSFSHRFHKVVGCSPSAYRKSCINHRDEAPVISLDVKA